jgi:hypothetical protein
MLQTSPIKHTPGPWSVSGVRTRLDGHPVLQIYGPDDKVYACVFYSDRLPGEHATSHADARLIAAAPEMLAALKFIFEHIADKERGPRDLYPAFGLNSGRAIKMARDAIAKAEGR